MNNEIKEIYLTSLEWTKKHDNMGRAMGNFIFKDKISNEEFDRLFKINKRDYFVLCNKDYITNLQERNNNLKEDFKRHVDRINELTERNDFLQEALKDLTQYACDLEDQICYRNEEITNLQEENNLKQDIIDKAIEYIDRELKELYKSNHQCKHLMEITYLENIKERLEGDKDE